MAMESLGGSMPAGQPVAVSSGERSHAFAIAAGGAMNHWVSTDGGPWSGPAPLPGANLVPSVPCAIALPDGSVHVFAIANGGPLSHWSSPDGNFWAYQVDPRMPIPGGWNGLAAASMGGQRIDVFATTAGGIIQYSFNSGQALPLIAPLPGSGGLPPRLLAAVSPAPGQLDVIAVEPRIGMLLHWHFNGSWSKQMIPGALHINSGLAAVTTAPGQVELFGIAQNRQMASWSLNGKTFIPKSIPAGSWPLADGVPAVVASIGKLDLFAIGQGDVLKGGPLVHWRREDGTHWSNPVAYDAGLAAGGVSAIKGASGLEAFGFQSGNNNCLLHWPAGIGATDHDPWHNWANNRQTDLQGHCRPQCLEELVAIVKTATRQNKRVRAVGSSWSFSDIGMTPGYIVETSRLDRFLGTVLPNAIATDRTSTFPDPRGPAPPAANLFVHVEAGIQLQKLLEWLDVQEPQALAPATMGGAAGQTLAGVISTSVHGSHYGLPPFPDWVRAIHLVGPDGRQYWIEPEDRPITDILKLPDALGPDVTIKRDNDWFQSAVVAVGSLGIIYSVILEVRSAYNLEETRTELPWKELKPRLEIVRSQFADADGVQLAIDPGTMASDNPQCYLCVRKWVSLTTPPKGSPGFDPLGAFCEGHLLLELFFEAARAAGKEPAILAAILLALPAIPAVALLLPPLVPALAALATLAAATPILIPLLRAAGPGAIGDLIGMALDKHPGVVAGFTSLMTKQSQGARVTVDLAHKVMGPPNKAECAARGLAFEIAFKTDDKSHLNFIDAALRMFKQEAANGRYLGGYFAVRFVGSSRAILSPQQSNTTCMIEVTGLRTLSSTKPLLAQLESLGRDMGGIQHWAMFDVDMTGKTLTAADVARAYPRLNTWRKVRWELTNGGTVHTFDNDFMSRTGLSDPPTTPWKPLGGEFTSGPAVTSWAPNRLDVFARGTNNALYTSSWTGAAWNGWHPVAPQPMDSRPAAVSWGPNRIDLFARGTDRQMHHMWWDGTQWSRWTPLGGEFSSGPAVASSGSNLLDVFGRGTDNALYTNSWDGSAWSGWRQVAPEPIDSDPAAIARAKNRIDVFARGTDKQMYHTWRDRSRWSGWKPLGGEFTSGAAVSSWGPNRLDVFGRGTDNALYTNSWAGKGWSGWRAVAPDPISSDPAAVSWGSNRIDLFARGTDNQMCTKLSDGT